MNCLAQLVQNGNYVLVVNYQFCAAGIQLTLFSPPQLLLLAYVRCDRQWWKVPLSCD